MGKPITKEYAPNDERVATFRITHGKLTAFQDECSKRGISLSQALIGFIDSVIDGGDIPSPTVSGDLVTRDDLNKAIEYLFQDFAQKVELGESVNAIADLTSQLLELRGEVERLKELEPTD